MYATSSLNNVGLTWFAPVAKAYITLLQIQVLESPLPPSLTQQQQQKKDLMI